MFLRRALPALVLSLAPLAACGGATVEDLPAAGAGGAAGSGTGGSGVAGSGGSGVAGSGGGPFQCTSSAQCPVGPCAVCPDGSKACPSAQCVGGTCTTSQPTCPVPMCKTSADCPQPGAPCQQCADGTFSCPSVQCIGGACVFDSGKGCPGSSCDPQSAIGVGMCFGFLGVKWNGSTCENVTGCSCEGIDCGALYKTPEQCLQAHASCPAGAPCAGKQCGDSCTNCLPGAPCLPVVEYCDANGQCSPGFPACEMPSNPCQGAPCGMPCVEDCNVPGCTPTKGMCNAAGQCSAGSPVCKVASCGAMKAQGQGLCDAFFGFAWNGAQCVGLGGCSCVGTDCNKLYQTMEHCLDEKAACACQGKSCGSPCTCPGNDCTKQIYSCTSDFNGACQPGPIACPL